MHLIILIITVLLSLCILQVTSQQCIEFIPPKRDYQYCPDINIKPTNHHQSEQKNTAAVLSPEEIINLEKKLIKMKQLYRLFSIDSHQLMDLDEACDPAVHMTWMNKSLLVDFVESSDVSWKGNICNFFKLLDCNPTTSKCECAPSSIYDGLELFPYGLGPKGLEDKNIFGPQNCSSGIDGLCGTFYIDEGLWPQVDLRVSVHIKCPTILNNINNSTYQCITYFQKSTGEYSKRCANRDNFSSESRRTSSWSVSVSLALIMLFVISSHCLCRNW